MSSVEEVLRDRLGDLGIPIVSDLPFGHGVPKRMFEKGRLEPQVRLRGGVSNPKTPILS